MSAVAIDTEAEEFLQEFVELSPLEQRDKLAELWEYFTPQEKRTIHDMVSNAAPWHPLPGPQLLASELLEQVDVLGFGGAAGGGKSDLGIGHGITKHKRIAIFRRESKELSAIEDRVEEILGSTEGYNSTKQKWRFGNNKQIVFGHCKDAGDEQKHQGKPKDFLMIDEATNLLESQARFLMGWVRTSDPNQHCVTLLTFNPPQDSDGEWVISFFAPWLDPEYPIPAQPGEIRYFVMFKGKEIEWPNGEPFYMPGESEPVRPQSRTFIPSRITDNPYLYNTGYMATLQAMPEPVRSQMLYGDFQAGRGEDPWRVCPVKWVEEAMFRWTEGGAKNEMDSVGVDVARGGSNDTAIMKRHGSWFDMPVVHPGEQTPNGHVTASLIVAQLRDHAPIHIEADGIGASPYDFLIELGMQALAIVSGLRNPDGTSKDGVLTFYTMRSKFWWLMREALDPANRNPIALPPDDRLKRELTAPRWKMRGKQIYVESRDEVIDRIGYSPDVATACCLANLHTKKLKPYRDATHEQKRRDYDPYAKMHRQHS